MGFIIKIIVVIAITLAAIYFYGKINKQVGTIPTIEAIWWGPGPEPTQVEDPSIRPFTVNISNEIIDDLHRRLNITLPFQPPLEGAYHNYGINTELLEVVVEYWKTKYDWKTRQQFLNQFPQYQTNIQGLNIHFIHARPKNVPKGVEVVPILLVHGWGGSIREFYEMIPFLITPHKGKNFVFEVIAPSLPGYGFSEPASRPGMAHAQIAQLFNKLMKRLKLDKYYVQGGDWGAIVTHALAVLYPHSVIGIHRNWCATNIFFLHWKMYVGAYFPKLFFNDKEIERNFPLCEKVGTVLLESGYFHIHATKPDTIGVALRDSPVGLAAYILEKFITFTNPAWKNLQDGGLNRKFTFEKLLDNIMIYWVSRSITTSARLYAETYSKEYLSLNFDSFPITIPAACNRFRHEIVYIPETILRETHTNLIHLTDYEEGGHFAAFELPEILGSDIFEFVQKVRNLYEGQLNQEL